MKATNNTGRPLYANVGGESYEILDGKSVDVDARTAMILGEYGATIDRDAVDAQLAKDSAESAKAPGAEPRVEPVVSPMSEHGPDSELTPSETPPSAGSTPAPEELSGADLDAALTAAGLSTSGTVAQKRARLANGG